MAETTFPHLARPAPTSSPQQRVAASLLIGLLVGFFAMGKGFSYFGYPPVFIGELVLVALVALTVRRSMVMPTGVAPAVAVLFVLLGVAQLVNDELFGHFSLVEELRGFALAYYAAFALITSSLLSGFELRSSAADVADRVSEAFSRRLGWVLAPAFLLALQLVAGRFEGPRWPGSGTPLLVTKSPDLSVTLAFTLPFLVDRLRRRVPWSLLLAALWTGTALLTMARSRAAVIGIGVALVMTFGLRARYLVRGAVSAIGLYAVLLVSGVHFRVRNREFSASGLVDTATAVLQPDSGANYSGTTRWRSEWWSAIWRDVQARGLWFQGNGWGTNLATKYLANKEDAPQEFVALRLPHSTFFSVAGRVGAAAAVLYLLVGFAAFVGARSSRLAPGVAASPLVRAVRGSVVAGVAVGLTDVYIESPQGGIVFWCGCGALWWLGRRRPHATPPAQPTVDA